MNCVKCVWPKAYLYDLARNEMIRRVFSFFPCDGIRLNIFQPKQGFFGQKHWKPFSFDDFH
jgi:hypothetical protein